MRLYLGLTAAVAGVTGGLAALNLANPYDTLSVVSVAGVAATWAAAWVLRGVARYRGTPVSRERSTVANRDAVVATLVGLIGLRRLTGFGVPSELITAGLVAALLAAGLYGVRWVIWYWRGEFED